MKPTPQITRAKHRSDSVATRSAVRFPKTDFQFLAGSFGDFSTGGKGEREPSFRGISEEYFATEARSHFATEAGFFAVIFVTSAIPVIQGVRGLVHFVYGML